MLHDDLKPSVFKILFFELIDELKDTNTYPYIVWDRQSLFYLLAVIIVGGKHLGNCWTTALNILIFYNFLTFKI